ncbi:MAG: photosystem II reaction center PsbP [Cyanobacteria bacterium J06635_10]
MRNYPVRDRIISSLKEPEQMWKRISVTLFLILTLCFTNGCSAATTALNSYTDSTDGYQFLYPAGWTEVQISNGPDVVFHDIIGATRSV